MHRDIANALDPEVVGVNRLPSRAPLIAHSNVDAARRGLDSQWRQSLDGSWNFQLVDNPDQVGDDWPTRAGSGHDVEVGESRLITVPGCWTRQGVDDWPHYTNIMMPWPGLEPPETPHRNPTGLYNRTFQVAEAWLDRMVVLHLGGFESMAAVWCNGSFVGLGKDSRLPSEFDITAQVVAGANTLDVMVIRYSDATWIEDQDHWWHGGLHRSVHLEARSRCRIDDAAVVADFDPDTRSGTLQVRAKVCGADAAEVRATLFDGDREVATQCRSVPDRPAGEPLELLAAAYSYPGPNITLEIAAGPVEPWSAELPRRYRAVIELLDGDQRTLEAVGVDVGFRRVEVRERRFLVNGVPVVLHGVNRHDHHPETGKVQTVEDLRADLLTMKRHNINAIRCAHYPNDHRLLDLCDELGFYVIDEANIECHGRLASLADDVRYLSAFVDRVTRMVLRDRNHPCVVMWSLGNESGHGAAHDACAGWVRATDPMRPVHYEGGIQHRFSVNTDDRSQTLLAPTLRERFVTDIVCPMYAPVDLVVDWAQWAEATGEDDRPLILCEYSHAMGNSNGSLADYTRAFHAEPALAGGFIWDWRDQGLAEVDENGRHYWAYGGHFGDEPNDANFCINGLVGPDGQPHPALAEVAWAYRPVTVESVGAARVRVANRRAFAGLEDLHASWKLMVDGHAVERGDLTVKPEAATSQDLDIPFRTDLPPGCDARLQVTHSLKADANWASAGHIVAWDEVELHRAPEAASPGLTLIGAERPDRSSVSAGDSSVRWDSHGPTEVVVAGLDLGLRRLETSLWRAPTDNDGVQSGWMRDFSGVRPRWKGWGLDRLERVLTGIDQAETTDGQPVVTFGYELRGALGVTASGTSRFVVSADSIRLEEGLTVPDEWVDLPRVGTRFEIAQRFRHFAWFGRGPHETYPDRKGSGLTQIWESDVADLYHPFVVPQEHGARSDTRWFTLTDPDGGGLRVRCDRPRSVTARFEHDEVLTSAKTVAEVAPCDTIEVHVDAAVRGLGTAACGQDVAPAHQVGPGDWSWAMTFEGVHP